MLEEKILIPAYKRTGNCAACGEAVYAPDTKQSSGWPLMSACVCLSGPKIAGQEKLKSPQRAEDARLGERAQAA